MFIHDSKIKQKERAAIQATAYACIHDDHFQIIASVKCNVPSIVIEAANGAYGEAVFYATADEKAIAHGMIDIYKNEMFRNSLVVATAELSGEYTWENAARQLWTVIQNSIQ